MFEHFLQELLVTETGKLIISSAITVERFLNNDRTGGGGGEGEEERRKGKEGRERKTTYKSIWLFLLKLISSPMSFLYYFYLWLPLFWLTLAMEYLILVIRVSARRSPRLHILMRHLSAFYISG